jgi:hypothetical protein
LLPEPLPLLAQVLPEPVLPLLPEREVLVGLVLLPELLLV